jgi:hypothetical protein
VPVGLFRRVRHTTFETSNDFDLTDTAVYQSLLRFFENLRRSRWNFLFPHLSGKPCCNEILALRPLSAIMSSGVSVS